MDKRQLLRLRQEQARRKRVNSYIPVTPFDKQKEFLALECEEALYGGAAGGGKSEALLMDMLQDVHVPGYSALILRRTFTDLALPGAIMDRSHSWLQGTAAHWDGREKRWTFPSGANLTFGFLDNERDRFRYQSAEFQKIGFDELTQFPPDWYRFMFTRLRRKLTIAVKPRMRAATNPGGIGHEWVKEAYLDAPEDRAFIKATFMDNPFVDQEAYARMIARADPITARQMRGEWIQNSGGLVYLYDREKCSLPFLPAVHPGADWHYLLGVDFGFVDSTAFVVIAWRHDDPNVYVLETHKCPGLTPSDAALRIKELERVYNFDKIIGDVGGLGKGYAEEARRRFHVPVEPAQKTNKRGYIDLLNSDFALGRIKILPGNDGLISELKKLPWNSDRSMPENGFEDHLADALLYAWRAACAFTQRETDMTKPSQAQVIHEDVEAHWREVEYQNRNPTEWWDE